tara:strand:- start:378 stop:1091 length:714 start_codon:yes stop_codon:yes gene_type:complete
MSKYKVDEEWTENKAFNASEGATNPPRYPNEYLVKVLSSKSYSGLKPQTNLKEKRVLEIGAFGANNLRFLYEKGYKHIYAIEITESLVKMCRKCSKDLKPLQIDENNIVLGSNLDIPFEDEFFDLIISIGTIHYSVGDEIKEALNLWKSKLRDNGRIYLQTTGPSHDFLLDSQRISENKWIWGEKSGFRKGKLSGFFDSEEHFEKTLREVFNTVSTGRVIQKSEFLRIDSLTAICEK